MVWESQVPPGPHPWAKHGLQLNICFPSYYQVPIDVTARWATFLGPHLYSWVDWVKFLAQENNNTNVATLEIKPTTFQFVGLCPDHWLTYIHTDATHTIYLLAVSSWSSKLEIFASRLPTWALSLLPPLASNSSTLLRRSLTLQETTKANVYTTCSSQCNQAMFHKCNTTLCACTHSNNT